ncbi:MAG TPA: D-alanyl-D-alanine carboxypeptidase family protein [Ktedonobacteraceae bacterium]|nr:D-alanyl-D-alanine carboxypeptidase family protein [Ktedonobacteraceae bacterium]
MEKKSLPGWILYVALLLSIGASIWFFTPVKADITHLVGYHEGKMTGQFLAPLSKGSPKAVDASEAILMDANTGNILFEKNSTTQVPMASTTKIMTALVAIQAGNLDQLITVSQDALDQNLIGSSARLRLGDKIALKDLLYGMMLNSGDDAATAIADGIAGSTEKFVAVMNGTALRMGLFQTHFLTVSGLDTDLKGNPIPNNQHYTTARDLLTLTRYAMSIPLFAQIVSQKTYTLPESSTHASYTWENTNPLLSDYPDAMGVKTGWTAAAGGCLVFSAKRNGHTLIGVVLHSVGSASQKLNEDQVAERQTLDDQTREADATTLLNWGFSLY